MSGELVAAVVTGAFILYLTVALTVRFRALRRRGASRVRVGGAPALLPYFVWVPYVVVALRPGPELAVLDGVRWLGLSLAVAGVAFAMWAALTLGRHFDLEIETHAGHEVVRAGPYAMVRHPIYAGLGLHFIGACLATGNLLLVAGTLAVSFPAFYARAAAEEALLRRELGAAYDVYRREVPMLVPWPR